MHRSYTESNAHATPCAHHSDTISQFVCDALQEEFLVAFMPATRSAFSRSGTSRSLQSRQSKSNLIAGPASVPAPGVEPPDIPA